MVFAAFILAFLITEFIRAIFVIIAIILPGGTKSFNSMSHRVGFMSQRLRGLLAFLCSFICLFAINAAIQEEAFTSLGRMGLVPQIVAEWVGLICIIVTFYAFLVTRTAPFRIWFTDFKSLSDMEKFNLRSGSWG